MDDSIHLTDEQITAEIHRIRQALMDEAPGSSRRPRDFDCPSIYEPDALVRGYHARLDELLRRRRRTVGP